jgi:hypothetical protein
MLKEVLNSSAVTIDLPTNRVNLVNPGEKPRQSRYISFDPPEGCSGSCWGKPVKDCALLSAEVVMEASEGRIQEGLEALREMLSKATCTHFDIKRFREMYYSEETS